MLPDVISHAVGRCVRSTSLTKNSRFNPMSYVGNPGWQIEDCAFSNRSRFSKCVLTQDFMFDQYYQSNLLNTAFGAKYPRNRFSERMHRLLQLRLPQQL